MTNLLFIADNFVMNYACKLAKDNGANDINLDYELGFHNGAVTVIRNDKFFGQEVSAAVEFLNAEFDERFDVTGAFASALGRLGGSATSKAKTKSSRENGKLGGRPVKNR